MHVNVAGRPPAPVLVASGVVGVIALVCLATTVYRLLFRDVSEALFPLAGLGGSLVLIMAMWQRRRFARPVVIILAVAGVLAALSLTDQVGGLGTLVAIPALLVIYLVSSPPSSRVWFAPSRGRAGESSGITDSAVD